MLVAPPTSVWRRSASSCVPASSPQSQWLLALTAAQAPRQPRADDEGRGGGQGGSGAAEESIPEKLHGPPRLLHELNRATAGLFPTKARSLRSSQASE